VKGDYIASLDGKYQAFSKFLGDRPFFACHNITHPDFHMYEMLCAHDKLAPGVLDKYPNLVAFMRRFEELPNLSAYLKSDK
jgi:hypothetical protein